MEVNLLDVEVLDLALVDPSTLFLNSSNWGSKIRSHTHTISI